MQIECSQMFYILVTFAASSQLGLIAVALFGLTLSYTEYPRSLLTVGTRNTLPIHIANLPANVTTPALYAIGTLTTFLSLIVIAVSFGALSLAARKRK